MMMKISGRGKALNLALSLLISLSVTGTALADDLEDQLADLQRQAEEQQAKTDEASARWKVFQKDCGRFRRSCG